MGSDWTIRGATGDDAGKLTDLIANIEEYYGSELEEKDSLRADVERVLSGSPPSVFALVVEDDEKLVGLASYSFLWPSAGATSSLFLKELFVLETHRRRGLARDLLIEIFRIAEANHCTRVEWMTDSDNLDAQLAYSNLGFGDKIMSTKIVYRVADPSEGIRRLVS